MKKVVRLAVVDPNDATRSQLKNLMLGVETVWLEAECSRYEFFLDVANQTLPDIVLIAMDSDTRAALDLIEKVRAEMPGCAIFVASSSQDGPLILQAMRNGAKEFLNFPLQLEDFMAALDRVRHAKSGSSDSEEVEDSIVITVAGVNGGIGSTSIAVNLASVLAQNENNSVALIDLDLALGDADVWLDIIPDYTIQDVAENITRIDYSLLKRSLTKHESGLFLLPRPVNLEHEFSISADDLRRIVGLLKATFSHLVIDISKAYSDVEMAAINASDITLLATQLDLPSLRNTVRLNHFFEQYETISEKLKVILNRAGLNDEQISLNKATEIIGKEFFWKLPNDYPTIVDSRNNGVPLILQAPKSRLTKSYVDLANQITNKQGDKKDVSRTKKSLFSFLGR